MVSAHKTTFRNSNWKRFFGTLRNRNSQDSYGSRQQLPTNFDHDEHHQAVLKALLDDTHVKRALNFGSCAYISPCKFVAISDRNIGAFAQYCPLLYKYYRDTMRALFSHELHLDRVGESTVYPAIIFDFGPDITLAHRHFNGLAQGMCSILAGGNYDYKLGGHLVLWDLALVIQFPPGSCVILSSMIDFNTVRVHFGETRTCITQYAAAGLFQFVQYGGRTREQFRRQFPQHAKSTGWQFWATSKQWAVKLFSTIREVTWDRVAAFSLQYDMYN